MNNKITKSAKQEAPKIVGQYLEVFEREGNNIDRVALIDFLHNPMEMVNSAVSILTAGNKYVPRWRSNNFQLSIHNGKKLKMVKEFKTPMDAMLFAKPFFTGLTLMDKDPSKASDNIVVRVVSNNIIVELQKVVK